tara:strand:+ start:3765 stop:4292 length:528 start_codon:yes stop_codon:yes gene_type:complete
MLTDADSLAKALQPLHDIVEPAPPGWWPVAPGWYWLAGFFLLLIAVGILQLWQFWRAQAYRRQARRELRQLLRRWQAGTADPGEMVSELASLLRRVALCSAPRAQVAALSGADWTTYLQAQASTELKPAVSRLLCTGPYVPPIRLAGSVNEQVLELFTYVGGWITQHRAPVRASG